MKKYIVLLVTVFSFLSFSKLKEGFYSGYNTNSISYKKTENICDPAIIKIMGNRIYCMNITVMKSNENTIFLHFISGYDTGNFSESTSGYYLLTLKEIDNKYYYEDENVKLELEVDKENNIMLNIEKIKLYIFGFKSAGPYGHYYDTVYNTFPSLKLIYQRKLKKNEINEINKVIEEMVLLQKFHENK